MPAAPAAEIRDKSGGPPVVLASSPLPATEPFPGRQADGGAHGRPGAPEVDVNRILNGVLVAVVSFFALLAAFSFSGLRPAAGGGAPEATLTALSARWSPDGGGIEVTLAVHSQGHPTQVVAVTYETVADGVPFPGKRVELDTEVAVATTGTARFVAELGPDFASRWWPGYARSEESSRISVRGEVEVREAGRVRSLPFEWGRSWQGEAAALAAALQDCPAVASPLCLEGSRASWDGGDLHVVVGVRNQDLSDYRVAGGRATLVLAGTVVAEAEVPPADLPAGEATDVAFALAFDGDALDAWWPGHAGRCEESLATARLELDVERTTGWPLGTAAWETPGQAFRTALVCGEAP
jgi:LEA14-like dessication related protein